jgi:hypothetical protein
MQASTMLTQMGRSAMRFQSIRRNIWPVLLLASASVSAQLAPPPTWIEFVSGPNISFSEATWELFTIVATQDAESSSVVATLPTRLGLDEKQHRDLVDHIKAAVKDSDTHSTSLRKAMCAKRAEFTTPESLARELDRIDEETLDHRDQLMAAAGSILGLVGRAKLEPVVLEIRDKMRIPRIYYLEAMRYNKETPAAVLTRMCAEFKK